MLTEQQKIQFENYGARKHNGINTYGAWNKHPDSSLTAWHFTFEIKDNFLYVSNCNRMCGEYFYKFGPDGVEKRIEEKDFNDMEISSKVRTDKIIESLDFVNKKILNSKIDKEQKIQQVTFVDGSKVVIDLQVIEDRRKFIEEEMKAYDKMLEERASYRKNT